MGASTSSHPSLRNYRQSANPGSGLADRTVTFGYTGSDLTSVTDPRGKTTTFGYDGSHQLTSITTAADTDTAAHKTVVDYGTGGYRVTLVRQETSAGVGPTTTFAYDDAAKKTTVTPPRVNAANDVQRSLVYEWDKRASRHQGGQRRTQGEQAVPAVLATMACRLSGPIGPCS